MHTQVFLGCERAFYMVFLNNYEQFSNHFISLARYSGFRAKQKGCGYGMLDLAIVVLACLGLFALPFIFMGYVRSRVRHALRAASSKAA